MTSKAENQKRDDLSEYIQRRRNFYHRLWGRLVLGRLTSRRIFYAHFSHR